MSLRFNNISGGVCSSAMALLYPKIPCVIVDTGANYPEVWKTINQLRHKRIRIITLGSAIHDYSSYYDFVEKNHKKPFYTSCSEWAKQRHLDRFYKTISPVTVNIGYIKGEENRAEQANKYSTKSVRYNFPMLNYTREECIKIINKHNIITAPKTGCWFCGKKKPEDWAWLHEKHPILFQKALTMDWGGTSLKTYLESQEQKS